MPHLRPGTLQVVLFELCQQDVHQGQTLTEQETGKSKDLSLEVHIESA